MRSTLVVAVILAAVMAVDAPQVRAGNQNSFFLGNIAAICGGAVAVVGDDGASLWYNPAGLVAVRRDTLDLSGSAYTLRIRDYPKLLRGDMPDRPDALDPVLDLSSSELLTVPSAVAYVRRLTPDLSLGFGVFVPLMDSFSATSTLQVREPSANLDAAVDLSGSTTVYTATVGLGWRVDERLRLGATLALYYQEIDVAQRLLFGYDSPEANNPAKGNGAIVQEDEIDRFGFNVFLGAQWQVSDAWALGLVLRSPLVQFHDSHNQRRFQLGADIAPDGEATITSEFAPLHESGFTAAINLSFAGTLAIAWTPSDRAFLSLELDIQPGSHDEGIVRELVWNVRLGGVIPLGDTFKIGAGLFTDRSWEPRPKEAWVDRVNYYGIATGFYFETPLKLVVDAAGNTKDSLVFTSVFGLRYAVGFGETLRAVADPTGVHTDPSLTMIDLTFHEFSLHVGSGLRF